MSRQISERPGNPAHAIREQYQKLMGITDPNTLKEKALELVGKGGISPKNAAKFKNVLAKEDNLNRLRGYLTNFVLAADGLAVI